METEIKRTNTIYVDVTKDMVMAYEEVRKSGVTNMFDISLVMELSGLDRNEVYAIMTHYPTLCEKYGIKLDM